MAKGELDNELAIDILDLAVETWHKVAEKHEGRHCNCFREEFGTALMREYGVSLYSHPKYKGIKSVYDRKERRRVKYETM